LALSSLEEFSIVNEASDRWRNIGGENIGAEVEAEKQ
jgi:hypothetical protein